MTYVTLPLETVDAAIAPFFQAVGKAVVRWQHLELSLFVLTHAALGTDSKLSSAVFYHIQSADSKIQLADRLCRASLGNETALAEWKVILKRFNAALPSRNALAHWEAQFISDENLGCLQPGEPPIALTRHCLDIRSQADTRAVTTATANEAAKEYLDLANELMRFVANNFSLERLRITQLPPRLLQHLERLQSAPLEPTTPPLSPPVSRQTRKV